MNTSDLEYRVLVQLLTAVGATDPQDTEFVMADDEVWLQLRLWLLRLTAVPLPGDEVVREVAKRFGIRKRVYEVVSAWGGINEEVTLYRRDGVPDLAIVEA